MVDFHGRFVWYELITTDAAAAKAFYTEVVGWRAQDASTSDLAYTMFSAGNAAVAGLMQLPEIATKRGAMPRWAGYIDVNDIDVTAERIKRLGGSVFVPPTDSNIGRVSIVADPQTANFALVEGLKTGRHKSIDSGKAGHVSWHELLAADQEKALTFYRDLLGWEKADAAFETEDDYQRFAVAHLPIGGVFNKPANEPVPFWIYYFNVGDIEDAVKRVQAAGGQIFEGPAELPNGSWAARCRDPQGAAFALQGKQTKGGIGWSAEWGGFSSKGRLMPNKPRS